MYNTYINKKKCWEKKNNKNIKIKKKVEVSEMCWEICGETVSCLYHYIIDVLPLRTFSQPRRRCLIRHKSTSKMRLFLTILLNYLIFFWPSNSTSMLVQAQSITTLQLNFIIIDIRSGASEDDCYTVIELVCKSSRRAHFNSLFLLLCGSSQHLLKYGFI